jgi:hypothetical protein
MVDFGVCRRWLHGKVAGPSLSKLKFTQSHNERYMPSTNVRALSDTVAGQFTIWKTGDADHGIYKSGEVVAHEWGMALDNETLPDAFERFLIALQNHM